MVFFTGVFGYCGKCKSSYVFKRWVISFKGVTIVCEPPFYQINYNLVITGSVLRCDVTRKILMKCFLSGMPDLKLGLNDKIGLEKESQLKSRPAKR